MGNCFAKPDPFVNNSEEGTGSNFEPLQRYDSHISSSLDFNGITCSSDIHLSAPWRCSVNYSQIGHDSAVKKTQIPENASVGRSVSVHLLEKSFVEDDSPPVELVARLNSILLFPPGESGGKSTSMGLVHESKEDPVQSQAESRHSEFDGLNFVKSLSSVKRNSVRTRSTRKVDAFSSVIIPNTEVGDEISGTRIPMESLNLFSVLSHINIEKKNCSGRVEEGDATAAKFKDCQSCSSGSFKLTRRKLFPGLRRPYNLVVEDEKAFGSPFSVESNSLWEKRRKCSSFDEFSDSSSDLFDIDFQKRER